MDESMVLYWFECDTEHSRRVKSPKKFEMDDLRELEAQADEERRQIVGKYAAGRARTDHIDDWEDPGR